MLNSTKQGKLIVIEGIDGSGKATQTELLYNRLKSENLSVYKGSFPNYKSDSSALVKMYLSGQVGSNEKVNPYAASTFYAADRYITYLNEWKDIYNNGTTILTDRYTTANIVHQMSRLDNEEWQDFLVWINDFEYTKLSIPKPDMVIYLDMHPDITQKLLNKRYDGDESKKDILEKDFEYMHICRKAALYAAEELNWNLVKCFEGENPLSPEHIHEQIYKIVIGN